MLAQSYLFKPLGTFWMYPPPSLHPRRRFPKPRTHPLPRTLTLAHLTLIHSLSAVARYKWYPRKIGCRTHCSEGLGSRGTRGSTRTTITRSHLGILVKGHLDPILAVFRSRVGARAHALGATQLSRAHVVFFDLWHDRDVDRVHLPGERLESVVTFRAVLAQSGFMNRNEDGQGKGDKDGLEVSVVVDSPYLPQYVDVQ